MTIHYTDQLLTPITIKYVGNGLKYYPGVPTSTSPFVYTGGAALLLELLQSGDYQVVSGVIQIVTTDLVPGSVVNYEEDFNATVLLSNYNPLPSPPLNVQAFSTTGANLVLSWV